MSKLTPKQEKFCHEYLKDFNGTRAAKAAGYSVKTAKQMATENLAKPDLQRYISHLVKKLNGEDPQDTIKKCIAELQMIAFGDYKDFVTWGAHGIESWTASNDLGEKTRLVQEVKETVTKEGGSRSIKLHDKKWAFEMLGKYYGFLKESLEVSNPDGSLQTKTINHFYGQQKPDS